MGPLTAPEPLGPQHDVSQFSSGVPALDAWLQGKARLNEAKGGARTYVACDADRVAGFYSLAASSVERRRVSSRVGRGMPDPVPVILLGQLAVDTSYQGRHFGSDLLIDAARRALAAADLIGARAIVVQAIADRPGRSTNASASGHIPTASRSCCSCGRAESPSPDRVSPPLQPRPPVATPVFAAPPLRSRPVAIRHPEPRATAVALRPPTAAAVHRPSRFR